MRAGISNVNSTQRVAQQSRSRFTWKSGLSTNSLVKRVAKQQSESSSSNHALNYSEMF